MLACQWRGKKEEILHGCFIHSMCPPSVFPCLVYWWQTESRFTSDKTSASPASIWLSDDTSCTQPAHCIWSWVVWVQILSREQQQHRPCTLGSLQIRQCPFKGKSAVQLTHLPPLFASLAGGKGWLKCPYTRRAWEKNAVHSGVINENMVGLFWSSDACSPLSVWFWWRWASVRPPGCSLAASAELKSPWMSPNVGRHIRTSCLLPPVFKCVAACTQSQSQHCLRCPPK